MIYTPVGTYPCTLREIAPTDSAMSYAVFDCVYAEYRGSRYILGCGERQSDVEKIAAPWGAYAGVCVYSTDKRDSTQINGGIAELQSALTSNACADHDEMGF